MRVLHLLSSTGFHGAESMTAELVRQQAAAGVAIHVAAFDNGGPGNTEVIEAVAGAAQGVSRIPCAGPLDAQAFRQLNDYIRTHQIDLVHSHKYKTTFYALPGKWARRFKLVTTYHNWLTHTRALQAYAALDKRLARFNDAAIAVSTPVAQELRRHVPAHKVHQIDNGIDTQRFQRQMSPEAAKQALGLDPARPVLGFVGRLSDEKGLPYLLEALAHHMPSQASLQVIIVGEGDARPALQAQIQQLGLGKQVHLLGNRRDTPLIYSAMDVFVLPSVLEAFPMVLLEAMSCGCPVVATDVGEVSRIIKTNQTGIMTPSRSPEALGQAIQDLLANPQWAHRMGQDASARVSAMFSAQAMAQQYLRVYQRCFSPG
jgi:glycosyltransferase involved in cell wall biosynthesis